MRKLLETAFSEKVQPHGHMARWVHPGLGRPPPWPPLAACSVWGTHSLPSCRVWPWVLIRSLLYAWENPGLERLRNYYLLLYRFMRVAHFEWSTGHYKICEILMTPRPTPQSQSSTEEGVIVSGCCSDKAEPFPQPCPSVTSKLPMDIIDGSWPWRSGIPDRVPMIMMMINDDLECLFNTVQLSVFPLRVLIVA